MSLLLCTSLVHLYNITRSLKYNQQKIKYLEAKPLQMELMQKCFYLKNPNLYMFFFILYIINPILKDFYIR